MSACCMADRLCVLVVTHGAAQAAVVAVTALAASENVESFRLQVLDNSPDSSVVDALPEVLEGPVRLVVSRLENRGFGAALNVGARRAVADGHHLILVLNPDCIVGPSTLAEVLSIATSPGEVVGVPLLDPSGCVERFGGAEHHRWTARNKPVGHGLPLAAAIEQSGALEARVRLPTGAFMLLQATDLEAAGFFDEDLFLYYEEVALFARMRVAGLNPRVRVAEKGAVVHIGGVSTGSTARQSALTRFHASRSSVIVARKHDRLSVAPLLLSRLGLAVLEMRHDRAAAKAVLAGLLAGLRAPLSREGSSR